MKDSPKIKSISQYQQINKKPKQQDKPSAAPEPKKSASVESTGEGYYKELMNQGGAKVKSISQYNKK